MASKSYGWDVRNIAKISPKMAKKQPFFDFFRFSQKLSIRFERNFLQIFYPILESYMCNGIKIVWLGCEKQPKLAQKWSKKGHFSTSEKKTSADSFTAHAALVFSPDLFMKISNFSKTVHTIFTKFCTVILHPKGPLRVQRHQNRMAGM